MTSTIERIREKLASLAPSLLEVSDDSHLHGGHAGSSGGGHYRLTIISPLFAGKPTLARHRMVYDALGPLMRQEIHALAISAKTQNES